VRAVRDLAPDVAEVLTAAFTAQAVYAERYPSTADGFERD
jgi:hypothetical protein